MRIVVLTDAAERHYYFANRIIEGTGHVVGVITGAKRMRRRGSRLQKWRKMLRSGTIWPSVRNAVYHRLFGAWGKALFTEKDQAETNSFGGSKARFEEKHASLRIDHIGPQHGSVNDPDIVEKIKALKPDAIVVMGTCLLKEDIIAASPLVLNIHTGLSPYYRGGYTNFWPIVEGDYGYFGVTVHTMSLGIDAGDIVSTARPVIREDDAYGSINSRCIVLGCDLMLNALEHAKNGTLQSVPQWTKGKLFFNRDMHDLAARRYARTLKSYMQEYVRREKEGALDTVRLLNNGKDITA